MIINHNLAANNANRQIGNNSLNASKSMEKLSSGLRINRAGDDAAGLAISEKMRGQIRGLDQASANAQDSISMIQTAEGALGETQSILQRMRELAVQSSNDTNVTVDRSEIQKEMDELAKEVTRISNNTEFNTQKLINGAIDDTTGIKSAKFHIGANANQDITLSIGAMDAKSLGISRDVHTATIGTNTAKINTAKVDSVDVANTLADGSYKVTVAATAAGSTSFSNSAGVTGNCVTSGVATADTTVVLTRTAGAAATSGSVSATYAQEAGSLKFKVDGGGEETVALLATDDIDAAIGKINAVHAGLATKSGGSIVLKSADTGTDSSIEITGALSGFAVAAAVTGTDTGASTWVATGDKTGTIADSGAVLLANGVSVAMDGVTATDGSTVTVSGTKDAGASVQLFANDGVTTIGNKVNISQVNGGSYTVGNTATGQAKVNFKAGEATNGTSDITVGTNAATAAAKQADNTMSDASTVGGLNVSTQTAASSAITTIQNAIETVSAERSKLGAYQNRLEHTISNLGTSSENLTSAESRIRDVDMAKEMSTFSKNNILSQAAQAMLAQANQTPQQVLQLLR